MIRGVTVVLMTVVLVSTDRHFPVA